MPGQGEVNALESYIWLIGEALWKQAEQHEANAIARDKRLRRMIMTAVQVQQEDLDAVGAKIEALVSAVDSIDTTQLPAGTLDSVNNALADLTTHVNEKVPNVTVTPPADTGTGDSGGDTGTDTPPVDTGDAPAAQ